MVIGDHGIAERPIDAVDGISYHGRTDVSDMHLLGGIGRRVVYDDLLAGSKLLNPAIPVGIERSESRAKPLGGDRDVQKAGPRNLSLVFWGKVLDDLHCRLSGISESRLLRNLQGVIALIIAELRVCCGHHPNLREFNIGERLGKTILKPFANSHIHSGGNLRRRLSII